MPAGDAQSVELHSRTLALIVKSCCMKQHGKIQDAMQGRTWSSEAAVHQLLHYLDNRLPTSPTVAFKLDAAVYHSWHWWQPSKAGQQQQHAMLLAAVSPGDMFGTEALTGQLISFSAPRCYSKLWSRSPGPERLSSTVLPAICTKRPQENTVAARVTMLMVYTTSVVLLSA
jgi:hypothetical protein